MSLKSSVIFGCLTAFFVILFIISKPDLLSPYRTCSLNELKLGNTSSDSHPPAVYGDSMLKEDENDDDSIERAQTVEFLERKSVLFSHYNSRMAVFTHFSETKSTVCMIEKNGHSAIKFVSCLLTFKEEGNKEEFKRFDSLLTFKGAFHPTCNHIVRKPKIDSATYERIVFIRDPFERFISGYLFVCKRNKVCFNCGSDFGCFLKTLYMCWKTKKSYAKICNYRAPSAESKYNSSGYLYSHMSPQVSSCDLLHRRKEFRVIEYSTESINKFLLSSSQPLLSSIEYENLKGRLEQKTIHAASGNDAEKLEALIRSNRTYVSMFAELYYMDYKIFDIELPRFIVDYKLHENEN